MNKFIVFLSLILFSDYVSATEISKFVEKQFCTTNEQESVYITVKKEHTEIFNQKIGNISIPAVAYGYGDLKGKHCKKNRITYICILDEACKPVWSCIIPR